MCVDNKKINFQNSKKTKFYYSLFKFVYILNYYNKIKYNIIILCKIFFLKKIKIYLKIQYFRKLLKKLQNKKNYRIYSIKKTKLSNYIKFFNKEMELFYLVNQCWVKL